MSDNIRIQLMNSFVVYVNGRAEERLVNKSRKGMMLLQQLLASRGRQVPNYRLLETIWMGETNSNPENALKTLISRIRHLLNELSDGFGKCLIADRGAYHWECSGNISVDLYEIDELLDRLERHSISLEERCALMETLQRLYTGDLLCREEQCHWALGEAAHLHERYMNAVRRHLDILCSNGQWADAAKNAGLALAVDPSDCDLRGLHALALFRSGSDEALSRAYAVDSRDAESFCCAHQSAAAALKSSIALLEERLSEKNAGSALICGFDVFRSLYELHLRSAERTGKMLMMAVTSLRDPDGDAPSKPAVNALQNALLAALGSQDVITQLEDGAFAVLMPDIGYAQASARMEAVRSHISSSGKAGHLVSQLTKCGK